ncbi:sushi, von Willebrand factor type A, EGF and pentraxin domain-containing protein 1-like [Tachypleus tridentatus]|uniref:sushi, von Willebrand factor type A, EGF and pentraxin domain-containing protein 1-like n=1 Tax=Tachypleus tridentatus TaxID=6853 RepID=UPI003FD15502
MRIGTTNNPVSRTCIRCPRDQKIIVDRGQTCAVTYLPPVRTCSRLLRPPGSVEIAVTLGPRPGTKVSEGEYFIQLHIKKAGIKLQTCQFRLHVKVLKCPLLKAPDHGYVSCSNGTTWGSICRFTCASDHKLVEPQVITCEGDQSSVQWTDQSPTCQVQECPNLTVPDHGFMMCTRGPLIPGSICRFACRKNYQLLGSASLQCRNEDGAIHWSDILPLCRVAACPPLHPPDQGFVLCSNGSVLGSTCKFSCRRHYLLVGSVSVTCRDYHNNIDWTGQSPVCRAQKCPSLTAPEHGFLSCTNERNLGSVCRFMCRPNFHMVGNSSVTCKTKDQETSWWTSEPPLCVVKQCPPLHPPDQGFVLCSDGSVLGSTCKFSCRRCKSTILDLTFPIKELLPRRPIVKHHSSWLDLSVTTKALFPEVSFTNCSRNMGFYRAPMKETPAASVSSDVDSCKLHRQGNSSGYVQDERPRKPPLVRLEEPPLCVAIRRALSIQPHCQYPEYPNHGLVHCDQKATDNAYPTGTICRYSCSPGYHMSKEDSVNAVIICRRSRWNITKIMDCKKSEDESRQCSAPSDPPNGQTFCGTRSTAGKYLPGTICWYFCNPGYVVSGPLSMKPIMVCQGPKWKGFSATRCPEPTTPRHGRLECSFPEQRFWPVAGNRNESKHVRGSTCRYVCGPGYVIPASQLISSVIQCRGPHWNSTVDIECREAIPPKPVDCTDQTLVTDGEVALVKKPEFVAGYGRDLDVKCTLEGELEPGEYINTCTATDPELRTNAECVYKLNIKSKGCSTLSEPVNGYLQCGSKTGRYFKGTVCIYKCNDGYVIPVSQRDASSIQCSQNSRWNSTKVPDCKKAVPPKPLDCTDQTLVARTGTIQVKKPRFVTGDGKDADVKCTLEKPLKPGKYINVCYAVDPDLQTSASCFQKVTVKGCLSPPDIQNGYTECQPETNSYTPGTVCMYRCRDGYVIPVSQSDVTSRQCLHDSSWNITKFPDCLKAVPPEPLDCADQTLVAGTDGVRVQIVSKCSLGRLLKPGKYTNICVAMDPELQTAGRCLQKVVVKALECSAPPKTERGYLECRPRHDRYPPETVCKYHCHHGYAIPISQSDISSRKCLQDSAWNTTKVPDCQKAVPPKPLDCTDLTLVARTGTIQVKKPRFVTGDGKDADVKCTLKKPLKPGKYTNMCYAVDPDLQTSASCFQKVIIKDAECRSPPDIQNGYTECHPQPDSYASGTVCKYHCRDTYVIPTSQSAITSRYCRHDFKWNITEVPNCRKAVVPKPVGCSNKTLLAEGGVARVKKPRFVAGDGRDLDVECTLEGELEPGEYINTCEAVDSELRTTSKCSYSLKIESQECSPPSLPSNGTVECWPKPESYSEETVCKYLCYEGYVIPTSQSNITHIYCRHDFKWNSTKVPNCQKTVQPKSVDCVDRTLVAEKGVARVKKPRFVAGDGRDLDVECTLEGELEPGEYINTCEATDLELHTKGKCRYTISVKRTECLPPPDILHGYTQCSYGNKKYPVGTMCMYSCQDGYVIPTSQLPTSISQCLSDGRWNTTEVPSCKEAALPKPINCTNETLVADSGTIPINTPGFVAGDGRDLDVECTLKGELEPGEYINTCRSTDPELRTFTECRYDVTIIAATCDPPPVIEHGVEECSSQSGRYPIGTTCEYHCHEGYVIPRSQSGTKTIECMWTRRWNTTHVPECKEVIPPTPLNCVNQTLIAENGVARVEKPRFVAGDGRDLDVECTLEGELEPGEYINTCESTDIELQTVTHCLFHVNVTNPKCSHPPRLDHGQARCISRDLGELTIGTICHYLCDDGYVIPVSQSDFKSRVCLSNLRWNISVVPNCLLLIKPKPIMCTNQTLVADGGVARVTKPRFVAGDERDLDVKCTLEGELEPGEYINTCTATDPELRTTAECVYNLRISEPKCDTPPTVDHGFVQCSPGKSGDLTVGTVCTYVCEEGFVIPTSQSKIARRFCLSDLKWDITKVPECWRAYPPKPVDCTNQTLMSEGRVARIKKPRFIAEDGRDLDVECTLEGELEPGEYINTCEAVDSELLTNGVCFYKIVVEAPQCNRPPKVDHGSFQCTPGDYGDLTFGSVCSLHCDSGYVVPVSQSKLISRICLSHLQWNVTQTPKCLKAYPPKPLDCTNQTLVAVGTVAQVKKPRFIAGDGRDLDVECTLRDELAPGEYINTCESTDPELHTVGFCSYRVVVIGPKCDTPPTVDHGFVQCSPGKSGDLTVGTVCTYVCEEGLSFQQVSQKSQEGFVCQI